MINSGGIKIVPEQVEVKLAKFIKRPFFVAGLEDEILGQRLILVVEGDSDSGTLLSKIVESKVLERYETPKSVHFLPQLVTTDNAKIRRKETLKLLQS